MKLAAIFSEHLMLQREKENRIFGETDREEEITVQIDDIKVTRHVTPGPFTITLPPHKAGGPYTLTCKGETDEIVIEDVLYGEVWLMNGQSNIELELGVARGGVDIIEKTENDRIRYYNVPKIATMKEVPAAEEGLTWKLVKKGDFKDISAIGYYFADVISRELNVPVGIVDCYVGGTSVTCWLPQELLETLPEAKPYLESYNAACEGRSEEAYQAEIDDYDARVAAWVERETEVHRTEPEVLGHDLEARIGNFPWPPPMGDRSAWRPAGVHYSMLLRIVPFTFKGIVYYQGEEDAPRYRNYKNLLKAMIKTYRELFLDEKLPFLDIQLPMWLERPNEENYEWPGLRTAQKQAVDETENTWLTCLIDCGELDNIHPVDKETPGVRLAVNTLKNVYESEKGALAMELDHIEIYGDRAELSFKNTYGEIKTGENELVNFRNEPEGPGHIFGFEIRIKQGEHLIPTTRIEGEKIILDSNGQGDILGISYGYFNYGKVNVYNKKGMPLIPF